MQKNATQFIQNKRNGTTTVEKPKKSTIEFLKQFARAYSYEKDQPYQLGNFIAN